MGWWLRREDRPEPRYTRIYARPWRAAFSQVREVEVRGPGGRVETLMVLVTTRYTSSAGYTSYQWDLVRRGYWVERPRRLASPPLSEAEMLRLQAENAGRG